MLHERRRCLQLPIAIDRQNLDAPAAVVGDQDVGAGPDRRRGARVRDRRTVCWFSGVNAPVSRLMREGADRSRRLPGEMIDLVYGVEEVPLRPCGQEAGTLRLGRQLGAASGRRTPDSAARRRCPCSWDRCRCRCTRGSRPQGLGLSRTRGVLFPGADGQDAHESRRGHCEKSGRMVDLHRLCRDRVARSTTMYSN